MSSSGDPDQVVAMGRAVMMRRRDLLAGAAAACGATACRGAAAERVSVFDYLSPGQQRSIAEGQSDLDCAPIIERAMHDAIAARVPLWLPHGTYLLQPSHTLVHADRNFECLAAIRMVTGMRLAGDVGVTLRMVPGFSSDRHPRAMAMFATTAPIADIQLLGLTLDMNGRKNPISPDRGSGTFSRFPQAHIFVSSRDGVPAARVDRAHLTDMVFRDANGVSCIVMAQTSDPSAALGRGWTLERCAFEENGRDTDDHSSIFAYAEDVIVDRCRFANARPFDGTGVNTAYEVHGSRQHIVRCTFSNMLRGIWVANNYSAVTRGTSITDNRFRTQFYGVDFFHDRSAGREIVETRVERNSFIFDDRGVPAIPQLNMKAAVQVASEFSQQDIRIIGNRVSKSGETITCAFLVVTGGASGARRHDRIIASQNMGTGLTFGSFVRTSRSAGLGELTITDNRWFNLAPSATMEISAGDAIERTEVPQPIRSLTLGGGSVSDDRLRRSATHGVFINTRIDRLNLKPAMISAARAIELGGDAHVRTQTGALD